MPTTQAQDSRRPRILICDAISEPVVNMLAAHAEVDQKTNLTHDELLKIIPNYDAMIVRGITKVTADVIKHGLNLKAIARSGAGLEHIDLVAAQKQEIIVVDSPDANAVAVAEHTMGLLLSLARRLPRADFSMKAGRWDKNILVGTGLQGKTLGIVGFGRIGRQVAIRARAFGMKIIVNQVPITPELLLEEVDLADLVDLLQMSDFVTLHVPLRKETHNMIGAEQLAMMKQTAFLINTARGGVLDEDALLAAIKEDRIAGAALDVYVREPDINQELVKHERVIATPHIAASTEDANQAAAISVVEQLIEIFEEIGVDTILPLRVVPMDKVVPHEHIDQKRVNRLANRLQQDGRLSNPPVVMETDDGRYMVLDGATRTAAFRQLGYPHGVVQLASPEEGLGLHTWFHVIQQIDVKQLFALMNGLSNIKLEQVEAEKADDLMFEYAGLCYIHFADGRVFLVHAKPGVNRLDALNQLTAAYIEAAHVDRTLNDNVISLKLEYPEMAAVVFFPEYTVAQVMQSTLSSGRYFPAGITRFIIPGRILRLNIDTEMLQSDKPLWEKNRWLHHLLLEKQGKGGIRFYAEPVFLLDE
ncbi:MAG: hypothetical protein DWQ04_03510 [Chloroflexi bacterium]|nr:MAG: hypothetical protein DWQ04_03510 [Chloroflexota bacterium]